MYDEFGKLRPRAETDFDADNARLLRQSIERKPLYDEFGKLRPREDKDFVGANSMERIQR